MGSVMSLFYQPVSQLGTTRRSTDIAQQDRTHRTHNTKPVTHTISNKSQNTCKHIECLHDTNLEHKLVDRSGLGGREWGRE